MKICAILFERIGSSREISTLQDSRNPRLTALSLTTDLSRRTINCRTSIVRCRCSLLQPTLCPLPRSPSYTIASNIININFPLITTHTRERTNAYPRARTTPSTATTTATHRTTAIAAASPSHINSSSRTATNTHTHTVGCIRKARGFRRTNTFPREDSPTYTHTHTHTHASSLQADLQTIRVSTNTDTHSQRTCTVGSHY